RCTVGTLADVHGAKVKCKAAAVSIRTIGVPVIAIQLQRGTRTRRKYLDVNRIRNIRTRRMPRLPLPYSPPTAATVRFGQAQSVTKPVVLNDLTAARCI